MAGRYTFCSNKSGKTPRTLCLPVLLAALTLCVHSVAFAQTKPERQSKAAKAAESKPTKAASADQKPATDDESGKPEDKLFKGMKYRLIGPFRGGRSLTAAGIPGDPTTYYFGATGGGVWKSTDGAMTWSPVFDKEGSGSIGSLAVANSDHNIIYVGTGEACIRGNISQGDGVYKSLDGGKTWKNVGLARQSRHRQSHHQSEQSRHRFRGRPRPSLRTQHRTRHFPHSRWRQDLGESSLQDENTGGIDVAFDPRNPNILFAALWQARRTHGVLPTAVREADSTARTTAARPGSGWKNMVCPKAPMDASASPSEPTPIASTP